MAKRWIITDDTLLDNKTQKTITRKEFERLTSNEIREMFGLSKAYCPAMLKKIIGWNCQPTEGYTHFKPNENKEDTDKGIAYTEGLKSLPKTGRQEAIIMAGYLWLSRWIDGKISTRRYIQNQQAPRIITEGLLNCPSYSKNTLPFTACP